MKKGEIYSGKVNDIKFPNKGIVETGDGMVVVKNTIPGQTISFVLRKNKPGMREGHLREILERSPLETVSGCACHDKCGGCSYQTLPYEEQLRIKSAQVQLLIGNSLKNHPGSYEENWFEGIKPSPVTCGYRNKMEFSFGDEFIGGPLNLGMHTPGHYNDVIDTSGCNIVDDDLNAIRDFTAGYFRERDLKFYRSGVREGYLRHLLLRKGLRTGEILADLVTTSQAAPDLSEFVSGLLKLKLQGKIIGILNTVNDTAGDAVVDEDTHVLYGQDFFYEELLGLKFKITAFSFFQTNTAGAEVLYETARNYIHGSFSENGTKLGTVFDLYSGTGTIAQMMASEASSVVGIELVPEAVEAAGVNAGLNGLDNCRFIAGDVLKCLDEVGERPDLIIMDPPRDGAAPKALSKILDYGVENIVYISCKPTSLARDLHQILDGGYRLVRGTCVDMFPMTGAVETVVLLSKL